MFFLAYGGLHWREEDILLMPTARRKWYVERLMDQKKHEQDQIKT